MISKRIIFTALLHIYNLKFIFRVVTVGNSFSVTTRECQSADLTYQIFLIKIKTTSGERAENKTARTEDFSGNHQRICCVRQRSVSKLVVDIKRGVKLFFSSVNHAILFVKNLKNDITKKIRINQNFWKIIVKNALKS